MRFSWRGITGAGADSDLPGPAFKRMSYSSGVLTLLEDGVSTGTTLEVTTPYKRRNHSVTTELRL
jgi:hypothetical protein